MVPNIWKVEKTRKQSDPSDQECRIPKPPSSTLVCEGQWWREDMDRVKGQQVRESEWEVDGGFVQPGIER